MRNDENLPEPKDQQTLTDNANLAKEWKPFPLPTPTYPCKAHNIGNGCVSEARGDAVFITQTGLHDLKVCLVLVPSPTAQRM